MTDRVLSFNHVFKTWLYYKRYIGLYYVHGCFFVLGIIICYIDIRHVSCLYSETLTEKRKMLDSNCKRIVSAQ